MSEVATKTSPTPDSPAPVTHPPTCPTLHPPTRTANQHMQPLSFKVSGPPPPQRHPHVVPRTFHRFRLPSPTSSPHLNLILRSFLHSPLLYSLPSNRSCPSLCSTVRPQVDQWLLLMVTTNILIVQLYCLTMFLHIFHCRGGSDKLALHIFTAVVASIVKSGSNTPKRQRPKARISSCLSSSPTSSSPTRLINPIRHRDCQSHPSPLFPSNNPICSSPPPSSTVHIDAPLASAVVNILRSPFSSQSKKSEQSRGWRPLTNCKG